MMCISADEYNIIAQMQVIDREVFFYLAQRTDDRTAVVGKKCRVSYSGMSLDLSERMTTGRRSNLIQWSSDDVRNAIRRLVAEGLFKVMSVKGHGNRLLLLRVFLAESLTEHKSVKKQVTRSLPASNPAKNHEEISNFNDLENYDREGYQQVSEQVTITNIHQHQQSEDASFSMSLDWNPDKTSLRAILFRAGGSKFSLNDIDPAWIAEFVSYWWGQSQRRHTHEQWTVMLAKKIVGYFRNPGLFERQQGIDTSNSKSATIQGNKRLPDWARIPRDDNQLMSWGIKNGYGNAHAGEEFTAYRGRLQRLVNARLEQQNMTKVSF